MLFLNWTRLHTCISMQFYFTSHS